MSISPIGDSALHRLPKEFADWFTRPLARFLRIEAASGVLLLLFTIAAIGLSNSAWAHARETLSPIERLEIILHPWVGFVIMPLFAFANAGLLLSFADVDTRLMIAVIIGFVIGKPLGILGLCWLALRIGIAKRPTELSWRFLAGGSVLAGIGFTMALFIANLAFPTDSLNGVKLGILSASIISAVAGLALLNRASRYKLGLVAHVACNPPIEESTKKAAMPTLPSSRTPLTV